MEKTKTNTTPSTPSASAGMTYEEYCRQQLSQLEDDLDGRCFGDMAEGQFVRSH